MASKGFKRLDRKITREYLDKGFGRSRAEAIGRATAGKVANMRHKRHGVPAGVRRAQSCVSREMKGRTFDSREAQQEAFAETVRRCNEAQRQKTRRGGRRSR